MGNRRLLLASRSPRRRELLRQIGIDFDVLSLRERPGRPADVDETPRPGEVPEAYVLRVATDKVRAGDVINVARRGPAWPVLAADTTVVSDGTILGKPRDSVEAAAMLAQLAGRSHQVMTAVAAAQGGRLQTRLSVSRVWFRALDAGEIGRYLACSESLDKAGAYAVQGMAAVFITRIEGSYSGIMGLPLAETADLLRGYGIELP